MIRNKLETIRAILTSKYWLIVSLCGAFFFFFALNRGGIVVFIDASFIFLLINILFREYRLKSIPACYWITLVVFGYLLGISILFYPQASHYRWMQFPIRMLCLVFAIHCLSQKGFNKWAGYLFCAVLSIAICWQLGAVYIFNMKWGTFTNPHFIASFALLTLLALVYFTWMAKGWFKLIFIPIALWDLDLLIKIGSRPAIAALTIAVTFGLLFLTKGRRKWIGILLICLFFITLYVTKYQGLADRLVELVVNLAREDRVQIWTGTWELLKDNSALAWIFGNGIGTFRTVWPKYAPPDEINEVFAHGFFIEVLYASGFLGLVVLLAGIIALFVFSFRSLRRIPDIRVNMLLKLLLIEFIAWIIHCGLTFPMYSKYSQYSLAFILGPMLAVLAHPLYGKDRKTSVSNVGEGG